MENSGKGSLYFSGTSGIQIPFPKYLFPKEHESSSRLKFYSTLFNSLEVNSSFYKLHRAKTYESWSSQVGEDFRFTFKVWKQITHNKNMQFEQHDIVNFMRSLDLLGNKKGCLLFQFPPSTGKENFNQLNYLLDSIRNEKSSLEWKLAVEFRNSSWYKEDVYELLKSYHASIVLHDISKSNPPFLSSEEDFIYVRFHGPAGDCRGSYTEAFLFEYSGYINDWLAEGKTVYVYFNNTAGEALKNLEELNRMIIK